MNIEQHYNLPFPCGNVYAAWVSADSVIPPVTRIEINPVVGGIIRLFIEGHDSVTTNEGRFLHIVPASYLSYTWEWNGDGKVTQVTVDFSATEEGTDIRIQHSGFTDTESLQMHAAGWDSYIEGLQAFINQNNRENTA